MIDLIELDPAELARIHDVPTEQVCCQHCRFTTTRPLVDREGDPYRSYCNYWEKPVALKTCCTSWQPRKESEEMAEKEMTLTPELEATVTGAPVININLESGAMLTINFWTDSAEDGDD